MYSSLQLDETVSSTNLSDEQVSSLVISFLQHSGNGNFTESKYASDFFYRISYLSECNCTFNIHIKNLNERVIQCIKKMYENNIIEALHSLYKINEEMTPIIAGVGMYHECDDCFLNMSFIYMKLNILLAEGLTMDLKLLEAKKFYKKSYDIAWNILFQDLNDEIDTADEEMKTEVSCLMRISRNHNILKYMLIYICIAYAHFCIDYGTIDNAIVYLHQAKKFINLWGEYKNVFYVQCLIAESIIYERDDKLCEAMALVKRSIYIVTRSKFEDNSAKVARTLFFAVLHFCRYLIATNNGLAYKLILLVLNNKNFHPNGLQRCSFLSLLGDIFFDRHEYEDAKQVYSYVLHARIDLLHTEIHPLCAYSYNLLGLATSKTKDYDAKLCEIYFTKALGIYKSKCVSPNIYQIAHVFENLGVLHLNISNYHRAYLFLTKAMEVQETINGPSALSLAHILYHLSVCVYYLGQRNIAIKYLTRCLDISKRYYTGNWLFLHPYVRKRNSSAVSRKHALNLLQYQEQVFVLGSTIDSVVHETLPFYRQ